MTHSSCNDPQGFADELEARSNTMEGSTTEKELADTKRRLAEFEDQLRYVFENIASEVYAFSECHCDIPAGDTPCAYCAAKHFCDWFCAQPDLVPATDIEEPK